MKRYAVLAASCLAAVIFTARPSLADNKEKDPDAIGNRDVGRGVNFYSLEKEIAMGKQMATDVERNSKLINDPVITEYVNRLVQNLALHSDAKVPFTSKVVDTEEVNAFALPGGFVFVNTGLLLEAQTEAEVAAVLSHEIGHVAARHGTRQATRGNLATIASVPLIFMGGWTGYAIQQAASLAIPMSFLKFSRGFESEADLLGIEYMYKAGYDPTAMVDFFERLESMEKKKPGNFSRVFSTHPMTEDRVKATQQNIAKLLKPLPEYVVTTSEFNDVQSRLRGLVNVHKPVNDQSRPTLRRASHGKIDDSGDSSSTDDSDDRPTLKRRQ